MLGDRRHLHGGRPAAPRDSAVIAAGVSTEVKHDMRFYADSNGELNSQQRSYAFGAGVRYQWQARVKSGICFKSLDVRPGDDCDFRCSAGLPAYRMVIRKNRRDDAAACTAPVPDNVN